MIYHENCLPADNSHEISCLICYFWKSGKIWNCRLLQIIDLGLRGGFLYRSKIGVWQYWYQHGLLLKERISSPGSITFPLKVAPMRKENNFKRALKWEICKINLRQYASLLRWANFDAINITGFTPAEIRLLMIELGLHCLHIMPFSQMKSIWACYEVLVCTVCICLLVKWRVFGQAQILLTWLKGIYKQCRPKFHSRPKYSSLELC